MYWNNACQQVDLLYSQIFDLSDVKSIAITSAKEGEGVSTLALKLAERANLCGKSALIVDLNIRHPSLHYAFNLNLEESSPEGSDETHQSLLPAPGLVNADGDEGIYSGVPAPNNRHAILRLKNPGMLEEYMHEWNKDFDQIIIEAPPLLLQDIEHISAVRIAEACDATVIVVMAAKTTSFMLEAALLRLKSSRAKILGCVYNDYINPSLKQELLREINRLPKFLHVLSAKLKTWVRRNRFLSIEI